MHGEVGLNGMVMLPPLGCSHAVVGGTAWEPFSYGVPCGPCGNYFLVWSLRGNHFLMECLRGNLFVYEVPCVGTIFLWGALRGQHVLCLAWEPFSDGVPAWELNVLCVYRSRQYNNHACLLAHKEFVACLLSSSLTPLSHI
jgi:hypothetical protein